MLHQPGFVVWGMQAPRFGDHDTAVLIDIFQQKYDKPVVPRKVYMPKQTNIENLTKKMTHTIVQFSPFNSTE